MDSCFSAQKVDDRQKLKEESFKSDRLLQFHKPARVFDSQPSIHASIIKLTMVLGAYRNNPHLEFPPVTKFSQNSTFSLRHTSQHMCHQSHTFQCVSVNLRHE